jgi:hypothetical protein
LKKIEKSVDKTTYVVYHVIMKTNKPKKTAYLSMKISAPLKERIEEIAQKEHRSLADQVAYLVELLIGDYIDGLDLSGVSAAPGGTAPQAWNDTYKNNRIVLSGFNTFKGSGDTEVTKNHVLFTFRNVIAQGRIFSPDDNGSYAASLMRAWLEGAAGDGSGPLAVKLKAALGGEYLLTIRHLLTNGTEWEWLSSVLFPPTEHEIFGSNIYNNVGDDGTRIHFPIYQKSSVYRVKRYNGSRAWWWSCTAVDNGILFAITNQNGVDEQNYTNLWQGGVAPAFCLA